MMRISQIYPAGLRHPFHYSMKHALLGRELPTHGLGNILQPNGPLTKRLLSSSARPFAVSRCTRAGPGVLNRSSAEFNRISSQSEYFVVSSDLKSTWKVRLFSTRAPCQIRAANAEKRHVLHSSRPYGIHHVISKAIQPPRSLFQTHYPLRCGTRVFGTCTRRSYASDATTHSIVGPAKDSPQLEQIRGPNSSAVSQISQRLSSTENSTPNPDPVSDAAKFWSHKLYKSPDGKDLVVHYCRTLESTEEVAKKFLGEKILGFDMEWKAQASASDGIRSNVSMIQIASKSRIALFQLAQFRPAKDAKDFIAPSLKHIIESPDITKVGVSIKADCTRLRKFLGFNARGIFELSHLYKLVKYCHSNPRLINKRLVNLNEQVEEHFGLPLEKEESVRCSDWANTLNYRQVHYAASDPYACICLFHAMDAKRLALDPMPPLPAHAELDLPIRVMHETPVKTESDDVEVVDQAEDSTSTPEK